MLDVTQERLYTLAEAAEILRVHYETIRDWVNTGRIKTVPVGGRRRITAESLNRFCGAENAIQPAVREVGKTTRAECQRIRQEFARKS